MFDLPRPPLYFARMTALEERRIKVLLKDAVVEVLEERHDLLTSRKKIFQRLARAA